LYKAVVLLSRLSIDTFITYQQDYYYFGLAVDQRDYTLLTEADLQQCTASSVTTCPANVALYHAQVLTCETNLFFQNSNSFNLCRMNLLFHYQTPTLQHHGSKWAYHFPEPRQVTIRNPRENGWTSHTVSLRETGLIHNASTCHIASQEIRKLPVLSKTTELPLDTPRLYLPDEVPTVVSHEISRIEAAMPPETTGLEYVKAQLVTPRQSFDVDKLLHVHHKSVHAAREFYWLRLATIIACITTVTLLLFFALRLYFRLLISRCFPANSTPTPVAAPRVSPTPDSELEHVEMGTRNIDPQEPVSFTTYALAKCAPLIHDMKSSLLYDIRAHTLTHQDTVTRHVLQHNRNGWLSDITVTH
jgi:hypothetical protein